MGTRRRHYEKNAIYRVSNRTVRGHALLTPTDEVSAVIMNNLAWSADKHCVDIYCYSVQPDGFDMLVRSEHLSISQFMCDFEGLTAREVNALHGESGKFFAGTFDCTKLESDVLLEQLASIMDAPRARGFVERPSDWAGVSSWELLEHGGETFGVRVDRTLAREIRRAEADVSHTHSLQLATTTHVLKLARLPGFEDVDQDAYWSVLHEAISRRAQVGPGAANEVAEYDGDGGAASGSDGLEVVQPREDNALPSTVRFDTPIGMDALREWPPAVRIRRKRTPAPAYLTRNPQLRERYREASRYRNLKYDWARKRLRNRIGTPRFPSGMIPLHKTRPVGSTEPRVFGSPSTPDKLAA